MFHVKHKKHVIVSRETLKISLINNVSYETFEKIKK